MFLKKKNLYLTTAIFALSTPLLGSSSSEARVVDFTECYNESKYGQREQANLTTMKDQMEKAMKDLNDQMTEISGKLNDEDVRDALDPQVEKELEEKMQTLSMEMQRYQQQYYYMMQQANMRTMNVMADKVKNASAKLAKEQGYHMVVNKEQVFHYTSSLDITRDVITELDEMYKSEASNAAQIKAQLSKTKEDKIKKPVKK